MFSVSRVRYEELSMWAGFRQAWGAFPASFAMETLTELQPASILYWPRSLTTKVFYTMSVDPQNHV